MHKAHRESHYLPRSRQEHKCVVTGAESMSNHFVGRAVQADANTKVIYTTSTELGTFPPKDQQDSSTLLGHLNKKTRSSNGHLSNIAPFLGLALTTVLSTFCFIATTRNYTVSGQFYDFATSNRALTSLIVQVLSGLLGLTHVAACCRLINYATRAKMVTRSVSLSSLHFWRGLTVPTMMYDVKISHMAVLAAYVIASLVPAALWAASITPVATKSVRQFEIEVPAYRDLSLMKEYPSEVMNQGPSMRNDDGLFAYNVGNKYQGLLLTSAASATTRNESLRSHSKYDNTQFVYIGRSYGAGAGVGLSTDESVRLDPYSTAYSFEESSYLVAVDCIYNKTTRYTLKSGSGEREFIASGYLPDSPPRKSEYQSFYANNEAFVVALGVSYASNPGTKRFVGFAAGANYSFLNTVQCTLDYQPTLFNVSVDILGRNITVTPTGAVSEFDPSHNISYVVSRQFPLTLANNPYMSLVGDSFNSSVAAYRELAKANSTTTDLTDDQIALTGIENALTAMVDDMLVCYKAAQLMIANDTETQSVDVIVKAIMFGKKTFICLLFALNCLIVLAVVVEAVRTRVWKALPRFDYADTRALVLGTSAATGLSSSEHDEDSDELVYASSRDDTDGLHVRLKQNSSRNLDVLVLERTH